jgi:hypothetical protein
MPRVAKKDKEARRAIALGDTAMATIVDADTSIQIAPHFRLTVNALLPQGQPSFAEASQVAEQLRVVERVGAFAIGDIANYMETRFGEEASNVFDATSGWNLRTLNTYRWLAKQVDVSRRRMDRLGVKHHLIVAALTPAKQKLWLDRAANDDHDEPWTAKQLADAIKKGEQELPEMAHWVIVLASNEQDADALIASMQAAGRTAKKKIGRAKESAEARSAARDAAIAALRSMSVAADES